MTVYSRICKKCSVGTLKWFGETFGWREPPNVTTTRGLYKACKHGNIDVVKYLAVLESNLTFAYIHACECKDATVSDYLSEHYSDKIRYHDLHKYWYLPDIINIINRYPRVLTMEQFEYLLDITKHNDPHIKYSYDFKLCAQAIREAYAVRLNMSV